jgi:hypothetical protein
MARQIERPVLQDYMRVVVLRDPLDRFFSTFNFAKVSVARGKAGERNRFAATVDPFEYFTSPFGVTRHNQLSFLGLDEGEPLGLMPLQKLLERAKERLSTMVVGVMPHLDALLAYTAHQFGCNAPKRVPTLNATPEQFKQPLNLSDEELAIMRHTLRFDYELFDFACARARILLGSPEPTEESLRPVSSPRALIGAPPAVLRPVTDVNRRTHGATPALPRKILFLHIPKTAGTSLSRGLERLASPRLTVAHWTELQGYFPNKGLAPYRLITGHLYAHQTDRPSFDRYLKITVLRDPLERFISAYNFARQAVSRGRGNEGQRFAAEVSPFEYFMSAHGVGERHAQLHILGLNRHDVPKTTPLAVLSERARARLDTMVVAVVPRLGEVLDRLNVLYGVTDPAPLPTANVTTESFRTATVSDEEAAMMRRVLAPDYALYDEARRRCEAFLADPRLPAARRSPAAATEETPPAAT